MASKNQPYGDYAKMFGDFKFPAVDYNAFISSQRKNADVATRNLKLVTESAQAIARRQSEMLKSGVEEAIKASREMWADKTPAGAASIQSEATRNYWEKSLNYVRELAEFTSKTTIEIMDSINDRVVESIDEMSKMSKAA